jgi:cell cycle arrest protein BUB3
MASETLGTALVSPPTDGITSLHFGGDDDLLLATSWDGGVRLYRADPDAQTSALVHHFPGPAPVLDGCFADGGGAAVASAGLGRTVTRHDLTTGAEAAVGAHDDAVRCVAWDAETGCLISAGWDARLKCWDLRLPADRRCVREETLPGKAYSMSLTSEAAKGPRKLVVATSDRRVLVYHPGDLVSGAGAATNVESSLSHQSRCVRCLPDGTGYVLTSAEGRVAWEYFDQSEETQAKKYAFKCHRDKTAPGAGAETIHPVHAVAFHPRGVFATGGGDGLVNVWDGAHKKRLFQYPRYPTGISALAFSADGRALAVAASYGGEQGETDAPQDAVYVRAVSDAEVTPKPKATR